MTFQITPVHVSKWKGTSKNLRASYKKFPEPIKQVHGQTSVTTSPNSDFKKKKEKKKSLDVDHRKNVRHWYDCDVKPSYLPGFWLHMKPDEQLDEEVDADL